MIELTKELEGALVAAARKCKEDNVKYLTEMYLLWGLLQTASIEAVLKKQNGEFVHLYENTLAALEEEKEDNLRLSEGEQPVLTEAVRRVFVVSSQLTEEDGASRIDTLRVVQALLASSDSKAAYLLKKSGLFLDENGNFSRDELDDGAGSAGFEEGYRPSGSRSRGRGRPAGGFEGDREEDSGREAEDNFDDGYEEDLERETGDAETSRRDQRRKSRRSINSKELAALLDRFSTNLTDEAREGRIDPLIGREDEVERLIQVICRRRKNNPLLVGEAGVGKTAIVEGLARKIVNNDVPPVLEDYEIFSIDMGTLVAGTRYRGDLEERLTKIIKALRDKPKAILFIDEIHQVFGGNGGDDNNGPVINILKPALAKGQVKVIGATTYDELRKFMNKDPALLRRFQKIDVEEPTVEDTIKILGGLKKSFEMHHKVKYQEDAIRAAVELSSRYMTDRKLPDKAIDVIDEVGARARLKAAEEDAPITKAQVEEVVSKLARIPPQEVDTDDKQKLKNLSASLKEVIYGQNQAIDALVDVIKLSRSGLGKLDRPIGSFLFAGPTGVGKTELARQLARLMGIELIRFDMSEYVERFNVSRLIGAPPGYVGYDQGGQLTEAVTKHPYSVLLLDEIEKAHPDIYNILLQIMDHGSLTDSNGKHVDFRNVILIMTTNAGARELSKTTIGFVNGSHQGDDAAEIKRIFTPEFRNRLDSIISFKPLGVEEIKRVVDKMLAEINAQLKERGVTATFGDNLKAYLLRKGFDPLMGARPMYRLIQSTVRKVLADEMLFGELAGGGEVLVERDETGETKLSVKPKKRPSEKGKALEKTLADKQ